MKGSYLIKKDDIVTIQFVNSDILHEVKVLYVPNGVGNCYHVKTKDELIIYVQMFETMTKIHGEQTCL